MKRRGFLGALAGGAVAGPGAAKQAITAASKTVSGGRAGLALGVGNEVMGSSGNPVSVGYDHKSYLLEQVARYKRVLSGELTDEEIEERNIESIAKRVVFEIETSGLRSMAESVKFSRMNRYDRKLRDERERFYIKRNLAQYLKELAGMNT